MPDKKLVEYAERFLATREYGSIAEHAAAFAEQLRAGCHQDLTRLIKRLRVSTRSSVSGKDALQSLLDALKDSEGFESWGLPDCACKKPECVYCSTGMATTPAAQVNATT